MISNLQKFKLKDIKKNLFHRGFKIIKIKQKKSNQQIRNILATVLLGFFIIGFFSIIPSTSHYVSNAFSIKYTRCFLWFFVALFTPFVLEAYFLILLRLPNADETEI